MRLRLMRGLGIEARTRGIDGGRAGSVSSWCDTLVERGANGIVTRPRLPSFVTGVSSLSWPARESSRRSTASANGLRSATLEARYGGPGRRRRAASRRGAAQDRAEHAGPLGRAGLERGRGGAARSRRVPRPRTSPSTRASGPSSTPPASIVHTNLGRAPLAAGGARAGHRRRQRLRRRSSTTSTPGARGRRDVHAEPLLRHLTGAEAALVVNNNAAATLLMLTALAQGREVIVSRGELVEIGGGFRVPDILRQSGAVLREVGTTNRTRAADYAAAIGDRTAPAAARPSRRTSRSKGFTARPSLGRAPRRSRARHAHPAGRGSRQRPARGGRGRRSTSRRSRRACAPASIWSRSAETSCSAARRPGIIVGRHALVEMLRRIR